MNIEKENFTHTLCTGIFTRTVCECTCAPAQLEGMCIWSRGNF